EQDDRGGLGASRGLGGRRLQIFAQSEAEESKGADAQEISTRAGMVGHFSSYSQYLLSVILRKFARADQGPDKFSKARLAVASFRQYLLQFLDLVLCGEPGKRRQIKFFEDFRIGRARFKQASQAAVFRAKPVHVACARKHMQSLSQVRVAAALGNR